jgi:DNA-binding NarL/FixJ family response regulator
MSSSTPTPIRVVIADDHQVVRTGYSALLDTQPDFTVVGTASNGAEAIKLCRNAHPDVILMDVRMPETDGIEATRQLLEPAPRSGTNTSKDASQDTDTHTHTRPRVLILTTFDLDEYAFAAIKAGASGFLLKDVPPTELLSAIRAVHSGDAVVAPSTTRRLLDRFAPMLPANGAPAPPTLSVLTEREREVLGLVAQGLSNSEIAGRLVLSEATVKTHVGRILMKLDLRDRVQAVVLAYETGLVRPGPR